MTPAIINIAWGHLPTNSSYGFMSTSGVSLFSGELGKSLQKQHSDEYSEISVKPKVPFESFAEVEG